MSDFQKSPYAVDVEEGKDYYWCRCGKTANQPCCDGSHKGSDVTPLAFTADKTDTLYLCGCRKTATPPYCDGSHKSL